MTDNLITKLFGTPISTYTDEDAVIDGFLIPFVRNERGGITMMRPEDY